MSQHDLTGDRQWSRALISGSGGEIPRPPVKLKPTVIEESRSPDCWGKLVVRKGDNPARG